ncbi:MAG TPA: hypothetical protein VLG69_01295 [Candidatus Andersenbacteria bacterium]|nr:hypothetical protein [Candidatus Andersenbacteria bacterium]
MLYRVHFTISSYNYKKQKSVNRECSQVIDADTNDDAMRKATTFVNRRKGRIKGLGRIKMTSLVRINKPRKVLPEEVTVVWKGD